MSRLIRASVSCSGRYSFGGVASNGHELSATPDSAAGGKGHERPQNATLGSAKTSKFGHYFKHLQGEALDSYRTSEPLCRHQGNLNFARYTQRTLSDFPSIAKSLRCFITFVITIRSRLQMQLSRKNLQLRGDTLRHAIGLHRLRPSLSCPQSRLSSASSSCITPNSAVPATGRVGGFHDAPVHTNLALFGELFRSIGNFPRQGVPQ